MAILVSIYILCLAGMPHLGAKYILIKLQGNNANSMDIKGKSNGKYSQVKQRMASQKNTQECSMKCSIDCARITMGTNMNIDIFKRLIVDIIFIYPVVCSNNEWFLFNGIIKIW